jgi:hypothetical protein
MKNFSLSLYAFHLRHTLTDSPDEVTGDAHLLWENLAKLADGSLPFPGLRDLRFTNSGCLDLGTVSTKDSFQIKANLQSFLLYDTYAADLTIFAESPTDTQIDVSQLKHFQPGCLLPPNIQASLGQTLWLYGEVDKNDEDCKQLAQKCANKLLAGTVFNPVLENEGKLFGSLLYEFQAYDPNEPQSIAKGYHILVLLNNSQDNSQASTLDKLTEAYDWLLNLLCCRHKIIYIYEQALERKPAARSLYSELEKKLESDIQGFPRQIADSEKRLDNLQQLLQKTLQQSFNYARCLRDLQAHLTAISTNIINYSKCTEKITAIGDIPKFWQDFQYRSGALWQKQIQIDIEYLSPGENLFSRLTDTIRNTLLSAQVQRTYELQQTIREEEKKQRHSDRTTQNLLRDREQQQEQRDRKLRELIGKEEKKLQNTIQAVGAGIGVGAGIAGVTATSFSLITQQPWQFPSPQRPVVTINLFLICFLVSFALGAGLGWMTWWHTKSKLNNKLLEKQRKSVLFPWLYLALVISFWLTQKPKNSDR